MKNSIILPQNFERIFMAETIRTGMVERIDFGDGKEFDEIDRMFYLNYHHNKQKLFQMILLYDELIVPNASPIYDYEKVKEMDGLSVYSYEDFSSCELPEGEEHLVWTKYLKPAIMPHVIKLIKGYFKIRDGVSLAKIASDFYDVALNIKRKTSKEVEDIIDINKFLFDLRNIESHLRLKEMNAPDALVEDRFFMDLFGNIKYFYDDLCWQLEISNKRNAFIVNCDYQLSKIGCDNYTKDINPYLDSYKILKVECAKLIGGLPTMSNIQEVWELKQKKKTDIKNLREVISNLEHILRNEGKEGAVLKAVNDVKKASNSLSKRSKLTPIETWTTLCSLPMGIAELLCGLPPIGLGISALGTGAYIVDKYIEKKNSWCEILR